LTKSRITRHFSGLAIAAAAGNNMTREESDSMFQRKTLKRGKNKELQYENRTNHISYLFRGLRLENREEYYERK